MTTGTRPLRRDAQRNREALLTAGREVFAADGIDGPLDEIARRAGVAIGTLYNRFPTRADLVEAVFLPQIEQLLAHTEAALATEDPWDGLVLFLERSIAMQVADRGFTQICGRTFPRESGVTTAKRTIERRVHRIVARAQAAGALREDFRTSDLAVVYGAATSVPHTRWRRALALVLDGLRPEAARPLPGR